MDRWLRHLSSSAIRDFVPERFGREDWKGGRQMTQETALATMLSGANVFLTGAPGSGKTYTLNKFIEQAREQGHKVAVTASTGIAASHIGGSTIHSWSGIGIKDKLDKATLLYFERDKRLSKRYNKTDVLVLDEISMLHGYRLDMVNDIAKRVRGDDRPFGGMQVILVGDLFQLPPVNRGGSNSDFAHLSIAWQELELKTCYLTEQHRQEGNDGLLELLECMRTNRVTDGHRSLLRTRMVPKADDTITKLYSHNVDVDFINREHLDQLPGDAKRYVMSMDGNPKLCETLKRNVLAPDVLELKVGAEVMFVANRYETPRFHNGLRGVVTKFAKDGSPIVKLISGRTIKVEPNVWSFKEDDRIIAKVEQLPLRLAWAITIHKSQGMSLDAAEIDLGKTFQPAMGYVALSRVRKLDGLFLIGMNDTALMMHNEIYELDSHLRELSEVES